MNLMTDYGLKKILGNKEAAIRFINAALKGRRTVKEIYYQDKEILGNNKYQRTAVPDLVCVDEQNVEFLVEIQRVRQAFFIDRSVFYTSARIQANAPKGQVEFEKWDYEQRPIFFIGLIDFELPGSQPHEFVHIGQICDPEKGRVLFDKLTYIYLELPKFALNLISSSMARLTDLKIWMFIIKNMHLLKELPEFIDGDFQKVVEIARIANMTTQEQDEYNQSLKQLRDDYARHKTSFNDGKKEGLKEGEVTTLSRLVEKALRAGKMSIAEIESVFSVDKDFILEIKSSMKMEKEKETKAKTQ